MLQFDVSTETFNPDLSATFTGIVFQMAARAMFGVLYRTKLGTDPAAETLRFKKPGLAGRQGDGDVSAHAFGS